MAVLWQGVEYPAAQWDVQGFTLVSAIPRLLTPGRGRVAEFTLLIGTGGTRIEMRVQARAADADQAPGLGFRFVDMDRAQAEVLHRIVDHAVNRQALSVTQLLNETEETRVLRQGASERSLAFRSRFHTLVAFTVIAGAGLIAWLNFATVSARYAAVTATAVTVAGPAAGMVGRIAVAPGDEVRAGDTLGLIRPADHEPRLEALADRRRGLEAEQAELRSRRNSLTQVSTLATTGTLDERGRIENALRLAERQLGVEREQLAALRANGLPTAERQRERARQEGVVLAAEQEVLATRSRLAALAQSETLAPMGILSGAGAPATTFEALDLRLGHVSEEIALAYAREERLAEGEPVIAPCDCTVTQIERRAGEWTQAPEPLFVLAETGAPVIHALVLADAARRISQGDRARVELADGSTLRGRVSRLSYDAQWTGYTGLRDTVFAAERYARVEIAPDTPVDAPVGMTARVSIDTDGFTGWLRQTLGL